jgi:flavoprotein
MKGEKNLFHWSEDHKAYWILEEKMQKTDENFMSCYDACPIDAIIDLENRKRFRCAGNKRSYCMDCLYNYVPIYENS